LFGLASTPETGAASSGKIRRRTCLVLLLAVLLLTGCTLFGPQEPPLSPTEVTNRFYRWYIGYPGNPLVDNAYRTSPYLAASLIEEVDATLASFEVGGADPFLLAQDLPERFTVEPATVEDDRATVLVYFYWWSGDETPTEREITLAKRDGEWKIIDIAMP
jgi:hypothetical protein